MNIKLKKSDLNLQVYTATETPATGNENDIVIISEIPMTNWRLSPDSPSGVPRADGDVWIKYSVKGNTFNALKNNTMTVATISVWQYVGGAWVSKTAKTYQSGAWKDWRTYLYNKGNEFTDLTGGWVFRDDSSYFGTGTLTKAADYMETSITTNRQNSFAVTKNAVDLTGFNVVTFDVTNVVLEGKLYVLANGSTIGSEAGVAFIQIYKAGKYSIDVSNLSGLYQIGFGTWSESTVRSVRVSEVYLA